MPTKGLGGTYGGAGAVWVVVVELRVLRSLGNNWRFAQPLSHISGKKA